VVQPLYELQYPCGEEVFFASTGECANADRNRFNAGFLRLHAKQRRMKIAVSL
jgi:hypothetical protein